jgi:hypothetical protein
MNYGETLTYWYLRLNGFFPLRNFVLHPPYESEGTNNQAADSDLLAVRFPHVYEEIGGQPDDWDSRFRTLSFPLEEDVIGLIIEVKTSPNANRSEIRENSFNRSRIKQAVQRMGMFKLEDTEDIIDELWSTAVTTKRGPYRLGKLLFSQRPVSGAWLNITLQDSEQFIRERLHKYIDPKRQARMFFPDELMQYLAWKSAW